MNITQMHYGEVSKSVQVVWNRLWEIIGFSKSLCNLTTPQLAIQLGVSENTLWKKLDTLQSMGWIRIKGNRQRYRIKLFKTTKDKGFPVRKTPKDKSSPVVKNNVKNKTRRIPTSETLPPIGGKVRGIKKNNIKKEKKKSVANLRKIRVTQTYDFMARYFCQSIQDLDGYRYWKKIPVWEKEFRMMHEEDGIPVKMLWSTLRWYCTNRNSKVVKLPKCYNAANFRGTYSWIMEKLIECQTPDMQEIDSEWVELADDLIDTGGFENSRVDIVCLAELLQKVNEWVIDITPVVTDLMARQIQGDLELGVVDGIRPKEMQRLLNMGSDGTTIPRVLGDYISRWSVSFKKWNGDLSRFSPAQPQFDEFLQQMYYDSCNQWLWKSELELCRSVVRE